MLKELAKVANHLDYLGLQKEADIIDGFIQKMAGIGERPKSIMDAYREPSESLSTKHPSESDGGFDVFSPRGERKYTEVQLFKEDGETPEKSLEQKMVGGSQEEPVLKWVKEDIILPVKAEIGHTFSFKFKGYPSADSYKVVELGTKDTLGKAVRVRI
jgi:hypothetical protein